MDTDELRESLQGAGFTQYEAEAYLVLVEGGAMSAVEVARNSDVPKSRVYDVLRNLEDRNIIETYEQDSLHARALNPKTVITDLREQAESLTETATEIEDRWERPNVDTHEVTLVKRFETVLNCAEDLVRNAENEIHIAVTPDQLERFIPLFREAHDRDIFIKVALIPRGNEAITSFDRFDFDGIADEVCYRELESPFVMLVDRCQLCFAPQPGSGHAFGIVADNQPLAYVFHWYYIASIWHEDSIVYSERSTEPPISYVDIRQCVIDLAPLFDEAAAITVSVKGYDTETDEVRTIAGEVVGLEYTRAEENPHPSLSDVSSRVTIYVDTGDRVWSIGGKYAKLEDLEIRRLTITDVVFDD